MNEISPPGNNLTRQNQAGIMSATRPVRPELATLLQKLATGQKIRLIQKVRVDQKEWEAVTEGSFRGVNYLVTGLSTDRIPEDDIVVPLVHFIKENGELSTITLDENSRIELIS